MPSRHSKNTGDQHHFSYAEKKMAGYGSIKQRIGSDSQLPFGYCALSMHPADEGGGEAVVSPSGHIYSKEAILEYLIKKSKEIKASLALFDEQEEKALRNQSRELLESERQEQQSFIESQNMISILKRKDDSSSSRSLVDPTDPLVKRKKLIDDTDSSVKLAELNRVCPWVPQFTPECSSVAPIQKPNQRLPSPFSGHPLRAKDLLPLQLIREERADNPSSASVVRFICPVTRKTITNQKVIMLRNTGAIMLESAFKDFAQSSKKCPLTGKSFKTSDILELVQSGSGFAASGPVEVKVHRPSFN